MRSLLLFLATLVSAEELRTPGEEVLAALAEASDSEARDWEASTVLLLREASDVYRYPASEKEAAALFAAIGAATRSKSRKVQVAALRALGSMRNPKAAVFIEPFLREKNPKPEERDALFTAIDATGRLRIGSLIPSLLALAKGGKDPTVADLALLAIGRFAESNSRERKALIEKTLALARSLQRNKRRWNRLRAPALRCLQMLTGQRLNSVDLFADWWKVAKEARDPFASIGATGAAK